MTLARLEKNLNRAIREYRKAWQMDNTQLAKEWVKSIAYWAGELEIEYNKL